ncbi:uncharacterized protein EV420DRAFT_1036196 [Desarmillaria tabescens]|uniref:Uncharacterized protein n=1 Tax=Armillaria tabescens TaxID=1929756 RepID=A0AA39NES5_ARMTA|nr:uncharacterized protein EV420DRAFT_1036196 [Desarmillaria tabescens]KAK0464297.1 hypothetical protein EV420DRAFT_1036196 [Desarmillaria tabescens]
MQTYHEELSRRDNETICGLQYDLRKAQARVAKLEKALGKADAKLQNTINDKDEQIAKLREQVSKSREQVSKLREQVTNRSLLELIALLHKGQAKKLTKSKPLPGGVQPVIDEIIKGVLDNQTRRWATSRQAAISRISPNLDPQKVDAAGQRLYYVHSRHFHGKETDVYILREDVNSISEVAAIFALVHFSGAQARDIKLQYINHDDALGAKWP